MHVAHSDEITEHDSVSNTPCGTSGVRISTVEKAYKIQRKGVQSSGISMAGCRRLSGVTKRENVAVIAVTAVAVGPVVGAACCFVWPGWEGAEVLATPPLAVPASWLAIVPAPEEAAMRM